MKKVSARYRYVGVCISIPSSTRCNSQVSPTCSEFPSSTRCNSQVSPTCSEFPSSTRCNSQVSPTCSEFPLFSLIYLNLASYFLMFSLFLQSSVWGGDYALLLACCICYKVLNALRSSAVLSQGLTAVWTVVC
jgi:hypothetical protein